MVIRLKESDIQRIVKRVLTEQKAGDKVSGHGQWMNTDQFDTFMEGLFVDGPILIPTGKFKKYKKLKDSLLWNNDIDRMFKLGKGIVGVTKPSKSKEEASFQGALLMTKGAGLSKVKRPAELFFYQEEDNNWKKKIFYCVVVPCTAKTCI
jgi:hypothetical protein